MSGKRVNQDLAGRTVPNIHNFRLSVGSQAVCLLNSFVHFTEGENKCGEEYSVESLGKDYPHQRQLACIL